jgi:Putative auto-transporter adhesin, head GIN domain
MKKIFLAILMICSIIKVQSQDDGKNLQTRKVSGFHGVEVSGGIDLYLSSGPESVSVSASSQTVRDHMITEVVDGILQIHLEKNWHPGFGNSKMRAYVSVTDLRNLGASGGGEIILKNQITAGDLDVSLSGGSNLKGKLNANHLVISQSGGSDVDIAGTVKKLDVDASGGSDLAGFGLVTDYLHLSASGGSDTEITVNKELSIDASGGSDVTYKGTAVVKQIKSSGSSSVTHKD